MNPKATTVTQHGNAQAAIRRRTARGMRVGRGVGEFRGSRRICPQHQALGVVHMVSQTRSSGPVA